MILTTLSDFIFVEVDGAFNDVVEIAGIKLKLQTAWKETHYVKVCGRVIMAPTHLNRKDALYQKHEGTPKYLRHVSHEFVKNLVNNTPRHHRHNYFKSYRCGSYEPEYVYEDTVYVQNGDLVYFHYASLLNEDNFWAKEDGKLIYRIPYNQIFCYVRNGNITMINGYVLVSEHHEQISSTLKLVNNKPNPRIGQVEAISHNIGPDTRDIPCGALCLFKTAIFTEKEITSLKNEHEISSYEIEGGRYYIMRYWDIIAVLREYQNNGEIETGWWPVGDYIKLNPDPEVLDNTIIYDPNKEQESNGKIFILDASLKKQKKNKNIGTGKVLGTGENAKGIEGRIWYGKHSYSEYEEIGYVRKGDVLGHEIL